MSIKKNAIGYIRVSTEEQSQDSKFGIEAQKQAILAYAETNGYTITDFKVDVISGVKDNRPNLDYILYELSPQQADAVIIFKNDRLARDTKLYFYYFYTLEKKNIQLLSTEEHFKEGDEFANIYRSLLMFVAEQERLNIATRTQKGRSIKANCGGYSGGNKPYGYMVQNGVLIPNPKEVPIVKTVFDLKTNYNLNTVEIADYLNKHPNYTTRKGNSFLPSTVSSILKNEMFYKGYYRYGDMKEWVKGVHEPLLTD